VGAPPRSVAGATWLADDERRQVPALVGSSHAVFIETGREGTDSDGEIIGTARNHEASVRFFTADGELPGCGHGTVAALAYLAGRADKPEHQASLRAAGGRQIHGRVWRQGDLVTAEFDAGTVGLREPTREELSLVSPALGLRAQALGPGSCVATLGRPRMLVSVASRSVLDALRPDLPALRDACLRLGLLGCYAYTGPTGAGGTFAARMFAPAIDVPDDIANANSTACLAAHLHATTGAGRVIVDMGDSLGSPARITATVADAEPGRVYVGGAARIGQTILLA